MRTQADIMDAREKRHSHAAATRVDAGFELLWEGTDLNRKGSLS